MPQQTTVAVDIKGFGTVHFPAEFTPEQIEAAIETDILPQRSAAPVQAVQPERPSVAARVGRGAMDIAQGAKQRILQGAEALPTPQPSIQELRAYANAEEQKLSDDELRARFQEVSPAGDYTKRVNDEVALYEKGRGPDAGFDAARLAGNVGATAPLGMVRGGTTALARMRAGALQGGAGGALQFTDENAPGAVAQNVVAGSGVGALAAPLAGWIGDKAGAAAQKFIGWIRGRGAAASPDDVLRAIPELEAVPENVRRDLITEAQEQIRRTGELNVEQLARKANMLANDVTPTKASVTRDPADWTREANLQKLASSTDEQLAATGGELTKVRQSNDAAITRRLEGFGGGAKTTEGYGQSVMTSLDDLAKASQKQVGELYEQVRKAKGDNLASDARRVFQVWDELKDSPTADPITEAVRRRLSRLGMLDSAGNLTSKTLTVREAEGLRQFINQQPNVYGKSQIIRAIDEDVLGGAGEDAFAAARGAAAKRFGMLDNPATQRALNSLGELSQGKTAQNFIKSQVIDAAEQDVAALVKTIEQIPDTAAAKGALDNLRGGVLTYLQQKAVNPNSGQVSGAKLATAIREVGESKLMRILGPDDYGKLQSLSRAALDSTFEPPYSAVNHSNTAPTLVGWLRGLRGTVGLPLPGVNEVTEQALVRRSAGQRLGEALSARSQDQLPQVPQSAARLGRTLQGSIPPALPGALNQAREPADKKARNRNRR